MAEVLREKSELQQEKDKLTTQVGEAKRINQRINEEQ